MKLLVLYVFIVAIAIDFTNAKAITKAALHGANLTNEEVQQCYANANLIEADLITNTEIKDESYKSAENEARAKRNGCFILCIMQKRGLIVDNEIQKEKFYADAEHSNLDPDVQAKIHPAVDTCFEQAKTITDMCSKSLNFLVCLWKDHF